METGDEQGIRGMQRRGYETLRSLLTIQKVHHTFSNILLEGKGMVQITDVLSRTISEKSHL